MFLQFQARLNELIGLNPAIAPSCRNRAIDYFCYSASGFLLTTRIFRSHRRWE